MEKLSIDFVLIIAFLVPGLLTTYALGLHYSPVGRLFGGLSSGPDVSDLVAVAVLSLGGGIVINAVTWATIRPLILKTKVEARAIDYTRLTKDNFDVFRLLLEEHYRYYQAYANLLTAILLVALSEAFSRGEVQLPAAIVVTLVCVVLFCAARSALKRTYRDLSKLLAPSEAVASARGIPLVTNEALPGPRQKVSDAKPEKVPEVQLLTPGLKRKVNATAYV